MVGARSTAETMCLSSIVPGLVMPGTLTSSGVREEWCQSAVLAKGSGMPWSERKMMAVLPASPDSSRARRMAPAQSSARRTLL